MTSHHSEFCDSEITEKDYLVRCQSNQSLIAICCYHTYKAQVLYLYGDYENSFNSLQIAKEYIPYVLGFFVVALHNFYSSLTLVNLFRLENQKEVQSNYLQELQKNQDQMKIWSDSCQESFLHKYLLVEAEICQLFAKNTEAMELYDRAIALAKENGFVNEEALACELAAKFYLEWGKEKIAQAYLTDAYYAYARWGAKAKLNDLERYYPQLLSSIFLRQDNSISPTETVVLSSHTTDHTTTSTTSVFDLSTVIKAAQAISSEIYLDKLVAVLLEVVLENAGAKKGVLILLKDDKLCIEAVATVEENGKLINTDITRLPVESSMDIPISVIYYVKRSLQSLVVDDITKYTTWIGDSYIQREQPKSLLCLPILNQGRVIGLLYLENNLTIGAFTSDRVELLNLITSQAAISLQNAQLYQQAQDNAKQLEYSLQQLQQIQLQLVQSEKMSTLGNLVAGIAHEINNPVGFLAGNLEPARDYIQDLLELIDLYVKYYPDPVKEIQSKIQDIDLEYVQEDLPKLISSMREGIDRIYDMSISLRTFSRGDTQKRIFSNIHEGIDSTIFILKHRLKASETRPEIEIVKNYSDLPLVQCFPGQLNQVFMNLIANAIDALDESNTGRSFHDIAANPNRITVTTNLSKNQKDVLISIKDNGAGMTADVRQKIFDHLFTTKPVGKGTGLGLAIARQIVIEKHGGTIAVNSTPGEGAEFVIQIPVEMG
jgi:signal transduction histidine kinase